MKCEILNFLSSLLSLNLFIKGMSKKLEIKKSIETAIIKKKLIEKFLIQAKRTTMIKLNKKFKI